MYNIAGLRDKTLISVNLVVLGLMLHIVHDWTSAVLPIETRGQERKSLNDLCHYTLHTPLT